ncbi:MAG: universal stress protein, partial [Flavobacteriales bacterium]
EESHVFQSYQDVPEGIFMMKMAKKRFEELLKKPYFKDVKVVEALQFDRTYENIVKQASKNKIDLIVMGSHGASGLKDMFVGSNTERVVRMSNCPVLTVKHEMQKPDNINNIIFASDFTEENYSSFPFVKKFAEIYDATIHLLKVNTPFIFEKSTNSDKTLKEFSDHFELKNVVHKVYNHDSMEQGVINYADDINTDIISLSTHGRKGLKRIIRGSFTEDVVNHSKHPVLSIKINKDAS